ncbi:MAG: ASCH domain-containing protein [Chromatiales bacterium]|nr:ASCH domain-containing protein [Chromatiales bacterium]
MKILHFAPYYEPYLRDGSKTLTIRLNNRQKLRSGDQVSVCIGWTADQRDALFQARIEQVAHIKLRQLTADDLTQESPDCRNVEAAALMLSAIYRRLIDTHQAVYAIRFRCLD